MSLEEILFLNLFCFMLSVLCLSLLPCHLFSQTLCWTINQPGTFLQLQAVGASVQLGGGGSLSQRVSVSSCLPFSPLSCCPVYPLLFSICVLVFCLFVCLCSLSCFQAFVVERRSRVQYIGITWKLLDILPNNIFHMFLIYNVIQIVPNVNVLRCSVLYSLHLLHISLLLSTRFLIFPFFSYLIWGSEDRTCLHCADCKNCWFKLVNFDYINKKWIWFERLLRIKWTQVSSASMSRTSVRVCPVRWIFRSYCCGVFWVSRTYTLLFCDLFHVSFLSPQLGECIVKWGK